MIWRWRETLKPGTSRAGGFSHHRWPLKRLPRFDNAPPLGGFPPPSSVSTPSVIELGFVDNAAARLQTFGFTFSDRVALLDSAERQGITRFRANMMLALLEHQAPARRSAPAEVPSKSTMPSMLVILGIELAVIGVLVMLAAL